MTMLKRQKERKKMERKQKKREAKEARKLARMENPKEEEEFELLTEPQRYVMEEPLVIFPSEEKDKEE